MNYSANHQGLYVGVCGVNPKHWQEYLTEKGLDYNSIQGGKEVLNYYLEQYGSRKKALLKYKGVETSAKVKKIVDKILRLELEYKDRIKILMKEIKENEQNRGH